MAVPSEAWVRGEPPQQSYVLPWTVAALKTDLHIVGCGQSVCCAPGCSATGSRGNSKAACRS